MMQSLVFKRSEYFICMAMINSISTYNRNCAEPGGGGGGGGAWEGVSKESWGTVCLPVWRHVSRQ